MVDGGENIREASWESVSSMLQVVSIYNEHKSIHLMKLPRCSRKRQSLKCV